MNKRFLIFAALLSGISFAFPFCSNKPEQEKVPEQKPAPLSSEVSGSFNESFAQVLQSYYSLKEAFMNADTAKANSAATSLAAHSDGLKVEEITGDTSGTIRETAKYFAGTISGSAKALSAEQKAEDKLRELNMITDALWGLTRTVKYNGQKVYYQFCSEALDNMGGYWLSDKIDTGNPYISSKPCSEVRDSLDYGKK